MAPMAQAAQSIVHDFDVATDVLRLILPTLRPKRKDSAAMDHTFELIVDRWSQDAYKRQADVGCGGGGGVREASSQNT